MGRKNTKHLLVISDAVSLIKKDKFDLKSRSADPKEATTTTITITGPKKEGVTFGLEATSPPDETDLQSDSKLPSDHYLIKFPKGFKDNEGVLAEMIAMIVAKALGFQVSDNRLLFVETSQKQIEDTKKQGHSLAASSGTPTIMPTILIKFDKQGEPLKKLMAGSDIKGNEGHVKPAANGIRANRFLLDNAGRFDIYQFLMQDPDSIGKEGNNKRVKDNNIFIMDTAIQKSAKLTFLNLNPDGNFDSLFYKTRTKSKGPSVRHVTYRNFSITEDAPLIDKLAGVEHCLQKQSAIRTGLDNFKAELKAIKPQNTQMAAILTQFESAIDNYQKIIDERLEQLKTIFASYRRFDPDQSLIASIIALEELLSPSRMYSKTGIPLRSPMIESKKRVSLAKKITVHGNYREYITIHFDKANRAESIAKLKQLTQNFKVDKLTGAVTLKKSEFTKALTAERVALLKHSETVSLKTAVEAENKDIKVNYLAKLNNLIPKALPLTMQEFIESLHRNYAKYKDSKYFQNKLRYLNKMYQCINPLLPKDRLTIRKFDSSIDYGKLVEAQACIVSEQQQLLAKELQATNSDNLIFDFVLNGKTVYDFFAQVDLLDINLEVIQLLSLAKTTYKDQLMANGDFQKIIKAIMSIRRGDDYQVVQGEINKIVAEINTLIQSLKPADTLSISVSALTAPTSPSLLAPRTSVVSRTPSPIHGISTGTPPISESPPKVVVATSRLRS